MLYQSKRSLEPIPSTLNIMLLISVIGALITLGQAALIVIRGDILCLNEGCEIVESLTTVPPLVFNLVGFAFFLVLTWFLWTGGNRDRKWLKWARLLLLSALAAEGVLVSFQHFIAETFCSYCLIILSLIVLLNLLLGLRQIVTGIAVFFAVVLAFSSLQFTSRSESSEIVLDKGVYGRLQRQDSTQERALFFSSTCPHCEEVIATIDDNFSCDMAFNPIDTLQQPPLPGLDLALEYSPDLNRRYLKNLGITEIPVLVVSDGAETRVLKGKRSILRYLDASCRGGSEFTVIEDATPGMVSEAESGILPFLEGSPQDEACSVEVECEEPEEELLQQ